MPEPVPGVGPVRTCVGCRRRFGAAELVRLTVGADGAVVAGGPSNGRGAWVGPHPDCLGAAVRRLPRALRREVPAEALAGAAAGLPERRPAGCGAEIRRK